MLVDFFASFPLQPVLTLFVEKEGKKRKTKKKEIKGKKTPTSAPCTGRIPDPMAYGPVWHTCVLTDPQTKKKQQSPAAGGCTLKMGTQTQ